jgi:hypothetical protein
MADVPTSDLIGSVVVAGWSGGAACVVLYIVLSGRLHRLSWLPAMGMTWLLVMGLAPLTALVVNAAVAWAMLSDCTPFADLLWVHFIVTSPVLIFAAWVAHFARQASR